jgi:hypothetical protein
MINSVVEMENIIRIQAGIFACSNRQWGLKLARRLAKILDGRVYFRSVSGDARNGKLLPA